MINKLKYLLIIFLPLSSLAQIHYKIEGSFNTDLLGDHHSFSIKDGDLAILDFVNSGQIDTVLIKDKKFKFEGDLSIPSVAMLKIKIKAAGGGFGNLVFLDNNSCQINYFQEKIADSDKIGYVDKLTTNSKFYELWQSLNIKQGKLLIKERELNDLLKREVSLHEKAMYKDELDHVKKELSNMYLKLTKENHMPYESLYIIGGDPFFSYDRYIDYYNNLSEEIKDSYYGKTFFKKMLMTKN